MRTAARLFMRHGYAGVGTQAILEAAGVPRGSLYHHFPAGKEALAEAAIEAAGAAFLATIEPLFQTTRSTEAALAALIEQLGAWMVASHFAEGCPVTAIAVETAPFVPALRGAADGVYRRWQARLAQQLTIEGHPRPESAAIAAVALIEGALVLARVSGSRAPLQAAQSALAALLGRADET